MKGFLTGVLPVFFTVVMLSLVSCASGREVKKVLSDPDVVSFIRTGELEKVKKMMQVRGRKLDKDW